MISMDIKSVPDDTQLEWLHKKWSSTASELSIDEDGEIWDLIVKQYSEKHRTYHNLSHLYNMLHLAEIMQQHVLSPKSLELSIWFHDIIYDPSQKDNEAKSAELAKKCLSTIDEDVLDLVCTYILSTTKHRTLLDDKDNKLFLDIDLAILATDPKTYQRYSKAIRKEYKRYPNFLYRIGRKKVLRSFLNRPAIFFTTWFHEKYESIARQNLQWELQNK